MTSAVIVALFLTGGRAAFGSPTCPSSPSYSPDFPNQSCLALNGNASLQGSVLQINPAATGQDGSAWYTTPQRVGSSFSTTFTFQLTGGSADGFAFVVQNSPAGTSALGPGGCGMGFADDPLSGNNFFCGGSTGGIPNSVAIGFKTYNNDGNEYPPGNSVFIASNGTGGNCENIPNGEGQGSFSCVIGENILTGTSIALADGNVHTVTVTYSTQPAATQTACGTQPCLDVILDGNDLFPTGVAFNMATIGLTNNSAYAGFTASTGGFDENNDILSWTFTPSSFGNINVCPSGANTPEPCSNTLPETFSIPAGKTIGSVQVVTQGVTTPGLDFSLSSAGTCTGFTGPGICTADVTFAPIAPGLRMGAVELFDNNTPANLIATQLIYGVGQGPAIAFGPGTQTTVASGVADPYSIAEDAAGNIFIATWQDGRVVKVAAGSGTQTTLVSGQGTLEGVAVDGAGNVYTAVQKTNGTVLEIPAGGGQPITLGSGLNNPSGVAVDGVGNVFIADYYNNRVVEVPAGGGPQTTVGSGLNVPQGVAVDGLGDVIIADSGSNQVVEVTASGTQTTLPFTGLDDPIGVAVDAAGDVFATNYYINDVMELTPAGVQTILPVSGLGTPGVLGVGVGAAGEIFLADLSKVVELELSQPPSLSFAATNEFGTSSPQSVTIRNIGNQALNAISPGLVVGSNFGQVSGPGTPSDCTATFSLAPGVSCNLSISFEPQAVGSPLTGTAVITDNALNAANAMQSVLLQGNAVQPEVAVPNVVGFTQAAAISAIGSAGLVANVTTASSSTVPSGDVISENPVAGTLVMPNSAVDLVVSTGLAMVAVPNIVDQTQSDATTAITGAGLIVGNVTSQSSSIVPAGSVISENPAAGTQTTVGSSVSLVLSTGQPPAANQLSLLNNYFVTGDYVSAGVNLRGMGKGGIATGAITISNTGPNSVPDGADILAAYLYWETVENTSSPSTTSATFMGYTITGQQIGSDQLYTDDGLSGTLRVYRADVNTYIPVGANGIRYASGTFNVSLPDGGGTALPLSEGASLVVIYRVLSPNFPLKSVVIYDGSAIPTAATGALSQTVQGFYDAVGGASGTGEVTNIFGGGGWNDSASSVTLGQPSQYTETLNAGNAYAAVILSTPVNNRSSDGILDAWKIGPPAGDPHAGQPGYYDVKTGSWVGLPGAVLGEKDLFVQLDYMCSALLQDGTCDFTQENLYPSPDADGNDPLAMVTQAFASMSPPIHLHLEIGNPILEDKCTDSGQLCEFPNEPGVVSWDSSLEISKVWPRNFASCATGGDCTARFPYGQKDSYHYVLFGFSLAIPAWNTRYGTLISIAVSGATTTITTADRGTGINACPKRVTITGVLGMPSLDGVYDTTGCPDTKTIQIATPAGVTSGWNYPLNDPLPEPVIGLTSGTVTSISGYSDLGGSDSAVTLGLWETAPNQDMSKRANVIAGTLYHEIGHTLGLTHGGLYYDTHGSYIPIFDVNCKPNYQSVMNYLFQLDGLGPNGTVAYSNQTLESLNGPDWNVTSLTDGSGTAATIPTSAWYVPYTSGTTTASAATLHCDGTPIGTDAPYYRVDGPIAPISPAWTDGQNITYDGVAPTAPLRGYNDVTNIDLRQVGATGGEFAALASLLSFGSSASPLNIAAGGNVTLGSGGTITLGSGGNVTLGSGGNVTLGSGGTITLGSGGNVTLGSGGTVTLGSGGTITLGSGGTPTTVGPGTYTFSSGGTITLGSGGNITLGSGGNVTLGSGGTITLGSGGNITLGSGGNVTLGSGGSVTLGGDLSAGSGGNVTLGSGGNVTLGSGGTVTLGSGGNVTLGSGGNVTLGSGGTITMGSGGTITLGSGGNVTLGSGGTITLGSGGTPTVVGPGTYSFSSGGTITLGSGGNVTLGSGGNVTLGSGGTITMGSGGNVTLGSGGNVTLGSGGTVTLGSGGNVTLGSGGNVTLGSGGNVTLGSGGATTTELTYDTANSFVRPPPSATYTLPPGSNNVIVNWMAPAFGVVQTYTIYRQSTYGQTTEPAIEIGSVSGIGGNPPATTFTDTDPDTTATKVVYTITTTLVADTATGTQRQSVPSPPAVQTLDQTIVFTAPLPPSSVTISSSPITVTATATSGLQVSFSATGACSIGSQMISSGVSSASVNLTSQGSCTITASQAGDSTTATTGTAYNAASPVSATFTILPQGSTTQSQTISFGTLPGVQYGGGFTVSATSSSGQPVSFSAPAIGPCSVGTTTGTASGTTTGAGLCTITASVPAGNNYSAASVTQSFTVAPAVIKVTANLTATYGQVPALPSSLTFSLSGYVNGDATANPPVVTGAPVLTTTATSTSNAGSYPITITTGTLAAANYSFLFVPGTVTIQQAPATISISNPPSPNAFYGGSFTPAYTYSGNGLPKESVVSSTTGACTVSSNLVSFIGTGTCTLTASASATTDYSAATGSPQSFMVDEAPAITSVNSTTFTVGTSGTFTVTTAAFPVPTITENGALPGGLIFVDNHNGTGTLSGKATVSGIYTITFTAQNGVGPAATQTFTLTSETTVPASGTTCNGVYVGTFSGNITVSSGQSCIFLKGGVTGNITETGGNLGLSNATIGGSIQITAGTYSIGLTTKINGNFTAQNIPTGAAQNQLCGASVGGNLVFQSVGTAATIGAGTPACPGNSITGSVTLQSNKAAVALTGNTVKGSLTDQNNTASTTLSGNTVGGSLTDQSNSGASVLTLNSISGNLVDQTNSASSILSQNTVSGSLTDQSNTGPTQVSSNKVTGTLLCQANNTITGGGNTASKKQGQCASF
ncbi:exported hypothetical protein [Candidatus Sulfotelmatomonas gaucii]|uniref:Uncharacterized protein n=1 Tax=Candidatus Sulfuritelmatomonas gaucii TaxID=2043161 RepID=A0A2N9LZU1_9BACT|nr:exported hypothetical protein [Candidatus Sulfotelmatomonas gaucii]